MSVEDRLRTALHDVADDTQVAPDSFDRIERRTVVARRRRRAIGAGLTAAALVAVAVAVPLTLDDDGDRVRAGPASDSRQPTTTTSTTTTEEPAPAPATDPAFMWPARDDARRYPDERSVVEAFSEEYLGIVRPVVETAGGSSFTVRPRGEGGGPAPAGGPRTVVEVASVDGRPVVVGATSPDIVVDAPAAGTAISSPVRVTGSARGLYEGTVIVEVRTDGAGSGSALATVPTVAAGSGPDLAPFSVDVPYETQGSGRGALVVRSDSGLEGTPQATVVPITFGPGAGETTQVTVFLQDAAGDFVPVSRQVPRTTGVLRAALLELLEGATAEEQARGLRSPFDDNAGLLRGVTITEDGTAVVDFEPGIVDELAGSDGAAVLASLDHTVFQFPSVTWVRYSVGGECLSFAGLDTELLCERRSRDEY